MPHLRCPDNVCGLKSFYWIAFLVLCWGQSRNSLGKPWRDSGHSARDRFFFTRKLSRPFVKISLKCFLKIHRKVSKTSPQLSCFFVVSALSPKHPQRKNSTGVVMLTLTIGKGRVTGPSREDCLHIRPETISKWSRGQGKGWAHTVTTHKPFSSRVGVFHLLASEGVCVLLTKCIPPHHDNGGPQPKLEKRPALWSFMACNTSGRSVCGTCANLTPVRL